MLNLDLTTYDLLLLNTSDFFPIFTPMDFTDILLSIIYMAICYLIGYNIRNRHKEDPLYQKWFIKGLSAKLWGGLAFALVYTFYFEYGGDTRAYWRDGVKLTLSFLDRPGAVIEALRFNINNVSSDALDIIMRQSFKSPSEYFVVYFAFIFNTLGFNSYFSTSLLFALFSYWGIWHFFKLFIKYFPRLEKQMAIAVLFVPSVFFWGSGVGKDSLILGFLGLFLYYLDVIISGKFWNFKALLIVGLTFYLMLIIKPYVLVSIIPAVALWRTLYLKDKIRHKFLKSLAVPVLIAVAIFAVIFSLDIMSKYSTRYNVESFMATAESMQGWHYREGENTSDEHGRGSSYTLGDYEDNWLGMLQVFPKAVNVTLYRPYIWEVENAGMVAAALESFVFLLFSIWILIRVGPFRIYRAVSTDSFLLMCFTFSIFFAFAVGFSSYNFGALSRYKIPAIPFFVASLFILRYKAKEAKVFKDWRRGQIRARKGRAITPGNVGGVVLSRKG